MKALDVIVAGSGPAGLALAAACCRRGLRTGCVSPQPDAPWTNTYAVWLDEASALGLGDTLSRRWNDAVVAGAASRHSLGRGYVQLDNLRLRARLVEELRGAGGTLRAGRLEDLETNTPIVIDATGGGRPIDRLDDRPPGYQAAWGRVVATSGFDPDVATFMDWTFEARDDDPRPSFLYALPIDERHVFVEETSLVGAPPMPLETLCRRLEARLDARGLAWSYVGEETERCLFPMGMAPARRGLWPVPFGAAAAFAHPATGYSVARSFRIAERVADAVVEALEAGLDRAAIAERLARAVFTDEEIATWQLYRYGMRALMRMRHAEIAAFFDVFFALPASMRDPFLAGTADAAGVRAVMWQVFVSAGLSTRLGLVRGVFGRDAGLLLSGLRTF